VTNGHLDVISRAAKLFGEVIVAVAHNPQKAPLFSVSERVKFLKDALKDTSGVRVLSFDGLVVDCARRHRCAIVLRGLRMLSDFEYEFQMALTNRKLGDDVETIFLMPCESYSYVSSKLLKEAASLGADLAYFLPAGVEQALKNKLGRGRREGRSQKAR
jgi:pantetheine-phosphate adenylyltransferase